MFAGILALVSIAAAFRLRPSKQSRTALLLAILPALLMLVLFYSLAIHLHHHLGAWPKSIGDRGFPPLLVIHEIVAVSYCMILMLGSVVVWPIAYISCWLIRPWRAARYYLGVYALSFLVCYGAIWLAPSQFWYWWWD